MTTYQTFDVLEVMPNRARAPKGSLRRSLTLLDPGMGKKNVQDRSGVGKAELEFDWFLDGRAEIQELKDFLVARKGRAVPFWTPSWRHDLVLAVDGASIDTSITIKTIGFTKYQFPEASRRQIAIFVGGAAPAIYRKVTGAQDNGNGTETLTLDSALGVAVPASTSMVSFLHLVRLSSDTVDVKWHHQSLAECAMRFTEVPREIP